MIRKSGYRFSEKIMLYKKIIHDDDIRHLIADRVIDVTSFAAAA